MRLSFRVLAFIILLCSSTTLYAQMAGWITHTDKDGNRYFADGNGKIYTRQIPEFLYKTVSRDGVDYYLEQSSSLINRGYKVEGLILLKSLKLLSTKDPAVYTYGIKAASGINKMMTREGSRFPEINDAASLVIIKIDDNIIIYNDRINYSIKINGTIDIIDRKIYAENISEKKYLRDGLLFGIKNINSSKSKHDIMVLVNSEIFAYKHKDVLSYIKEVQKKEHGNPYTKIDILKNDYVIESIISESRENYSVKGIEMIAVKNNKGFIVRVITGFDDYTSNEEIIKNIINSITY